MRQTADVSPGPVSQPPRSCRTRTRRAGRPRRTHRRNGPKAGGQSRTFDYDRNDNLRLSQDELTTDTTYAYTARNELEKKVEIFLKGTPNREVTTSFVYDRAGNLICTVSPRAWNSGSRCTDQTNPGEFVTQYQYNEIDELERVAVPDNAGTPARAYIHRRYDANGNLKLTTLPVSNSSLGTLCDTAPKLCTDLTYFDPGWVRSSLDHVNPKVYFDYEPEGWQRWRQACDDGCRTATQKYYPDGLLRSVKRHSSLNQRNGDGTATYVYDPNNNLTSALAQWTVQSTEKKSSLGADYNGYDEPTRVREQQGSDPMRVTDYTYDPNGNVATRLDNADSQGANGRKHEFTYDQADQLTEDYDWVDQSRGNAGDQRTTYVYTKTGWDDLKTVDRLDTAPSDWQPKAISDWEYFDNGDLKTLVNKTKRPLPPPNDIVEVEHHDLTYTSGAIYMNGNRVQDRFKLENASSNCSSSFCTIDYSYGPRDEVTLEDNSWRADHSWSYNDQLNVETEIDGPTTRTFTYDGNQLSTQGGSEGSLRYLYDVDGNLDCVVAIAYSGSRCPAASIQAATIDPALKVDYVWDFLNRLQSYRQFTNGVPGDHAEYEYDALDRLQKETDYVGQAPPQRTCFTYLGLTGAVTDERRVPSNNCGDAPTLTKGYGFDADLERASMSVTGGQNPGNYFYTRNVHGDPSLLLKSDGTRTGSYAYSAYGGSIEGLTQEQVADTTTPFNPYRFNDRRLDPLSGSSDMGARRYSSSIGAGRFLQFDSYGAADADLGLSLDPLTMNRYAFAAGNPVRFFELDGHEPCCYTREDFKWRPRSGAAASPDSRNVPFGTARSNAPEGRPRRGRATGATNFPNIGRPACPSPAPVGVPAYVGETLICDPQRVTRPTDPGGEWRFLWSMTSPGAAVACAEDFGINWATAWNCGSVIPSVGVARRLRGVGKARPVDEAARGLPGPGASALEEASEAAFKASRGPISIKAKHLPRAGGNWSKFAPGVNPDATVREALQSPGAIFRPNRDAAGNLIDGYRVYADLGRTVGTRGETGVRVIVTPDGAVKTAFPGRPWG